MKMKKLMLAVLALALICTVLVGCNKGGNTPGGNTPGDNTNNTTPAPDTTEPQGPATTYGNFTTEGTAIVVDDHYATNITESQAIFGSGSSYSDEKLTNIYQIVDYIANYKQYVEEYDVQEQLDKIYSETGFTLDMGFAANMLKHYLDSTGETYDFSADMPDLLTNAKIESAQSTNISAAMKAAENLVQNGQSNISIYQTATMNFQGLKHSDGPAYYALGTYHTLTDLTGVSRTGDAFSATVTFRIVDMYAWDITNKTPLFADMLKQLDDTYRTLLGEMVDMDTLENFSQADIAELQLAGYAMNYASNGTITYEITWTAGQSFDQATVLSINGEAVS